MRLPRPVLFGPLPSVRAIRARVVLGWLAALLAVVLAVAHGWSPLDNWLAMGLFLVFMGAEVASRLVGGVLVTRRGLHRIGAGGSARLPWAESGTLALSPAGIQARCGHETMLLPYDLNGLGLLVFWLRTEMHWALVTDRPEFFGSFTETAAKAPPPFLPRTAHALPGVLVGGVGLLDAALLRLPTLAGLAVVAWGCLWWYARSSAQAVSDSYWVDKHIRLEVAELRERGLLGLWAAGDRWIAQFENDVFAQATYEFGPAHPLPALLQQEIQTRPPRDTSPG